MPRFVVKGFHSYYDVFGSQQAVCALRIAMAEGKLPSKISKRISMMKQWLPFLNPWKSVRWMRGRYFSPSTWTEITQ